MSTLLVPNVYKYVKDVFPNIPMQRIEHVINLVQSSNTQASVEEQMESIINMLVGYEYEDDRDNNEDGLLEEASGGASTNSKVQSDYFNMLMDVFPDACPTYVNDVCSRMYSFGFDEIFDDFISHKLVVKMLNFQQY
ncbi:hypothetical protein FQA39_LY10647 [Lamprigera yunnana]|nr:hypothetical protein FQA39_LY10647 [Lamprigera yunnana]